MHKAANLVNTNIARATVERLYPIIYQYQVPGIE